MKQSDIFTIILVASIGTIIAFFTVDALLGNPNEQYVTFKKIDLVESTVAEPDPEIFNVEAVNPTIEVYVGECEDVDQNGILDQAELGACGKSDVGAGDTDGGE